MAIWLTRDRIQPGPVFGNKGVWPSYIIASGPTFFHPDNFEGLAIFLDTWVLPVIGVGQCAERVEVMRIRGTDTRSRE
jgi:hypothetical protein